MNRPALLLLALTLAAVPSPSAQQPAPVGGTNEPFYVGVSDAASLARLVETRLAKARAALDTLLAVNGPRTIQNTLRPYDDLQREIQAAAGLANIVRQLHPEAATRAAAETLAQTTSAFSTDVSLNRGVYDALAAIDLAGAGPEIRHYLQRDLSTYRRQGVDRDEATRTRLRTLRNELLRTTQAFDRNFRQGVRRVTVHGASELAGLPPDYIAAHKPDASGVITLTTEAPDLQPVMMYADSDDLRRRLTLESQNVGYPDNMAVIDRLLSVRAEIAHTLGYRDWASYDIEDRMAASAAAAGEFIDRVVAASARKVEADYRQLLDRKRQDAPGASVVQPWEGRYYTERVRRAAYDFDSQAVRPYFAYDRVRDGVLAVAGRLFGIEFRAAKHLPVWHASVEPYEVFENGRLVGRIYLDMHPRADKGGSGASASTARSGVDGVQIPEVVLICRFPGGQSGDPGLMTHDQVVTFFHEFGHLIHAVSSGRQRWVGLTRVSERDFIEAPSQMLEEWTLDPATLATFATHYQTNEPIPPALVQQMIRAGELGRGHAVRQQMVYAKLSLSLHDRDPGGVDPVAIHREITEKYLPTPWMEGSHFPASFTHLANPNYSAAYYTYIWSLVIAKDLFSHFDRANLLSAATARRYREAILTPGGSKPAAQLIQDFLGRPFSFASWESWLNRETPAPTARTAARH